MKLFKKKMEDFEDLFFTDTNIDSLSERNEIDRKWNDPVIKDEEKNSGSEFLKLSLDSSRINMLFMLVLFGLFIIMSKTFYLQVVRGAYYQEIAEGNRIKLQVIKSNRGIIYDRNKTPLVQNIPNFSLYTILSKLPKDELARNNILEKIASIINETPEKIKETIKNESENNFIGQPIALKEKLDYNEAILLSIESSNLPGIFVETSHLRKYFNEDNLGLSHVLGYTGKLNKEEWENAKTKNYTLTDYIGKTGIELVYEEQLKGLHGKKRIEVDALGKEKKIIAQEDPTNGDNLILSLDTQLQKKSEEILKEYLTKTKKEKGVIVILDPRNGEVLSLVNYPSFDNNDFSGRISQEKYKTLIENPNNPLFNKAIKGEYPSGSVIKPIIATAGLQEGIISSYTTFLSTGGIRIGDWFFPDWQAGGHGMTDVRKAIAQSVNTFFYIIGGGYQNTQGLGPERIYAYATSFGLHNKLGIDLPGESDGFIPTPQWKKDYKKERWYIGDTYNLSIGQGDVLVTPLQVATYTAVFANGGTLYKPHLLKEILNSNGSTKEKIEPTILNEDFIKKDVMGVVRQGMRDAVKYGSARRLSLLSFTSAGKTGTAQFSSKKEPHAWFTCFAPFENPEIVITVLVEEGEEGSAISAPIAKDILEWWGTYKTEE